jgi:putative FmdB family regulatory protein
MPLYEYECDACGRRFEVIQKFADQSVETCRHCGKGPVHRLLSSPAIQFKGTGWYITDYAQKGKSDSTSTSESAKSTDAAKSDTSTDAAKSDTSTTATDSGSGPKSDTAASSQKPATGGTTKDSKE